MLILVSTLLRRHTPPLHLHCHSTSVRCVRMHLRRFCGPTAPRTAILVRTIPSFLTTRSPPSSSTHAKPPGLCASSRTACPTRTLHISLRPTITAMLTYTSDQLSEKAFLTRLIVRIRQSAPRVPLRSSRHTLSSPRLH